MEEEEEEEGHLSLIPPSLFSLQHFSNRIFSLLYLLYWRLKYLRLCVHRLFCLCGDTREFYVRTRCPLVSFRVNSTVSVRAEGPNRDSDAPCVQT